MLQHVRLSRYQSQLLLLWAWRTVGLHKLTCVGAMEGTNGRPTRPSSNAQASKRSARFSTLPAQGWGVGVTVGERLHMAAKHPFTPECLAVVCFKTKTPEGDATSRHRQSARKGSAPSGSTTTDHT